MKRTLTVMLSLLMVLIVATSCGGSKTIDVEAAADTLRNEITYEDELNVLDSAMYDSVYSDLKAEDIVKSKVYTSSTATAEEIAVFEAKDAEAAERIEEVLKNRISSQKELYASYAADEVKRLDGAALTRNGNYVVLCVAGDSAAAEQKVKSLFA